MERTMSQSRKTNQDHAKKTMIYRGLYHFYVAHQKGIASAPVKYFAAPENQDLGIFKRQ